MPDLDLAPVPDGATSRQGEARPLDRCRRSRPRGAGCADAPGRPISGRQHREAVRGRRRAAARRGRPAVARRAHARGAAYRRCRPLRERGRHHGSHASGHRAGIPDRALDEQVARDQAKVWTVAEFLDLAAAKPPLLAPGTSFSYANTDYTLLSLVIERITGRSWRHEVAGRVLRPLRLTHTHLPAPGQRSIERRHARLRRGRRQVGRREPGPLVRRRRGRLRAAHQGDESVNAPKRRQAVPARGSSRPPVTAGCAAPVRRRSRRGRRGRCGSPGRSF